MQAERFCWACWQLINKDQNETTAELQKRDLRRLTRLVVLRASQIDHCAFCIDMHVKELRDEGESDARIYLLNAWREAPCYSEQERAALAWTEAVTTLAPDFVPDEVFEEAWRHFSEQDLANLTVAIGMVNT